MRLLHFFVVLLASSIASAGIVSADVVYSTSFDSPTYSAGNLNGQDGWVAQSQWQADGGGNISNTSGAFIRAHNSAAIGTTDVGEMMQLITTFTIGTYTTPSNDIAGFEQGILQQGMSHQQGSAGFDYGVATGLFFNPATGNLVFRENQGMNETGTSSVVVGTASGLGGTTYTMNTKYTKTAADTWSVAASLTDGTTTSLLNYIVNGETNDLDLDSDGGGTIGGIQALPSGGGSAGVATPPFGPTSVADFSIEITSAVNVPEPSSLVLLCIANFGLLARRRR